MTKRQKIGAIIAGAIAAILIVTVMVGGKKEPIAANSEEAIRNAINKISQAKIDHFQMSMNGVMSVWLIWDVKNNAETAKSAIKTHCEHLRESVEPFQDVSELAVYWSIPYLEKKGGKCQFERYDGSLVNGDYLFDL